MIRLITMSDIRARFVSDHGVLVSGPSRRTYETIKSHLAIQIQERGHFHFLLFFQQSFKSPFFLITHRKSQNIHMYIIHTYALTFLKISFVKNHIFLTIPKNKSWDDIMRFNRDLAKVDF